MGPKKQPTKKSKKDGKKKAKAKDPEPLVEMIDLDEQLAKGGNVPALINQETNKKAAYIVHDWQLKGSQAVWRMACLIEMERRRNLMAPLQESTMVYMGQVVARRAAPRRLS